MLGHNLLVLAALTATAAPVPPDDASGLRAKFEKGRTFYQEMTCHTAQTMNVLGQEIKQTQTQTYVTSWTPEKQDGDRWLLKQKIEAVKMEIEIGGNTITYDSTKPKAKKEPIDNLLGALVGSEFRVTLDNGFNVLKLEGREKLIKKLVADGPEMEAMLRGILSEDALKETANPMLVAAPRRKLDKGDYWVSEKSQDLGPIGRWTGRWQYLHAGKEGKLIKLKLEAIKYEFQPKKDAVAGELPFAITASDFKTKNSTGVILFDPEKGRLHSAEMNMDLEGNMTVTIGGEESRIHLVQTQKTTWKASDSYPLPNK
jgi:Family of unknown function (DUF6263)